MSDLDNSERSATARNESMVEHLFRHEYGKILASLLHGYGFANLRPAEDAIQDALLKALGTWPLRGTPENPAAWLQRVASNAMIDQLRSLGRQARANEQLQMREAQPNSENTGYPTFASEMGDKLLAMMFACCSSEIPEAAQITIILKWLSGFSIKEIAKALLESETAIAQRLSRARTKLQAADGPPQVPSGDELSGRLPRIEQALYLIFNEGYASTQGDSLVRSELCVEAIRLTQCLLNSHVVARPSTHALMALFCFHAARIDTRINGNNELLLLADQDRRKWDRGLIARASSALAAARKGNELSRYHYEAGIASCHAAAKSFADTNWQQISYLYKELFDVTQSPVVAINYATAISYGEGITAARAILDTLAGDRRIEGYHLYWAVLADLSRREGKKEHAAGLYLKALSFTSNDAEREFLSRRLADCRALES